MYCCPTLRACSLHTNAPPPPPQTLPLLQFNTNPLPPEIFPPSAPSTCLDSKGSCAPWKSGQIKCNRDLNQPYWYVRKHSQAPLFTVASGNEDLQAQQSKTHISLHSLTVSCDLQRYFCENTLHFRGIVLSLSFSTSYFILYKSVLFIFL
ncbi:hypothetical protein ATANTOWER_014979 [Ataeniobius toweri]|uniref:Uncharacterized protein n=1 Tax=Ataeniobius toweri TaxID=208326 RepID=A0ABU7C8G8_9TELE|nr:hypothetical protein [Ataeniobius toweri]